MIEEVATAELMLDGTGVEGEHGLGKEMLEITEGTTQAAPSSLYWSRVHLF